MKNHITEEQALAVVKEGKEQGIKIIYLKNTLSGMPITEPASPNALKNWTHTLLAVWDAEQGDTLKQLLAKHGVELDLEDQDMIDITNADVEDGEFYPRYGRWECPYYADDHDGLRIYFCRTL